MNLRTSVSPHGRLLCETVTHTGSDTTEPAISLTQETATALLTAFESSPAEGLLLLAGQTLSEALPADFVFWRKFSRQFFQAATQLDEERQAQFTKTARTSSESLVPSPNDLEMTVLIADAPPMRGLEYLTPAVLKALWSELTDLVRTRAAEAEGGLAALLHQINPFRQLLGRVTFHLAENKRDEDRPFAFLATYTHRMSAKASVQHLPLARALKQYAGQGDQGKLAELLAPVRAAADRSSLIKDWLTSRALFQPQALTIPQAYRFLRDAAVMEDSGLVVRVPNWWQARKPPRPTVKVQIGQKEPSRIGVDGLLDFSVDLALDGETLTKAEQKQLLAEADGLVLLRGKWVEVNRDQLQEALSHWKQLQEVNADGVDFLQGMRLLAGASLDGKEEVAGTEADWASISAGNWLRDTLEKLRDPSGVLGCSPGDGLNATLRPYQADGVRWLWFMTRLRLGACLADDMGLGKTIQVIDLLLRLKTSGLGKRELGDRASLLIVPASLVGNWKQELTRFAPQLKVVFAHRSESDAETLDEIAASPLTALAQVDLVVTTYTLIRKADWIGTVPWKLIILDEAQAIKNASSAQTKSVKKLGAMVRIALTGTPVENHIGDLWSLFDFCCPGLLGTAKQFKDFVKRLNKQQDAQAYGALRRLVQPYILRRLKTDPLIAPDLPEKTEMRVECGLSKKQAALYEQVVEDLARQLEAMKEEGRSDDIQRRGIVLGTMMRLKQICNHPSQYLAQPQFAADASGKFLRLAAICEPIAERQEKVLIFTQFQSLCEPLAQYLADVFGQPGLVLHGGVPVAKRKELVQRFQEEDALPFFVISVKAGGTGLNLTAASHVVHFDRWWNPAVENQATDRAFRIGQKRNVLVHKFVCRGTLEERIDQMIRDKQDLADKILGPTREGETLLTEMSDQQLLKFVALDITRAAEEV
ncbi:MAG: ATP-dependent helicase [Planctomycetaceae bacterium]|nr:ATP-dependent helicase [Planctomycetaceae bacterium]